MTHRLNNCRPIVVMVLVALVWTTTVLTTTAHATNYYVRKTGNDSNPGTDRNQAFRTLAKATSVAGQGDVLIVGAGTYDENVVIKGSGSNAAGWFVLYADRNGVYTGDKGDVVVRPAAKTWTVRVFNTGNILFFGFAFEGNPATGERNYGCQVTNTAGNAYYLNCNFNRLTYALRDLGTHRLFASGCRFQRVRYGIYTSGIQSTNVINCQFAATQYGCIGYDGSGVSVTRCRFTDRVDPNDPATSTRGVYAARTALSVSRCDFSRSTVGVYGTALKQAVITRCSFLETTSHAVRCNGESLSMSRCTVKDGHHGVTLGDTAGNSATLSDLVIESMRVGITAHQGDYDFRKVTLRGNKYALYQRSGNKRLSLSKNDRVDFIDNDVAIYTNHAIGEDADLIVSDRDLSGNARGLVSYRTRVSVDNCSFGGASMGAYLSGCKSVRISDSTFDGNPADPKSCTYGLYARSDQIDVQRCNFTNSRYGITIHNTSDNPPLLRDLISENHTAAALYMRNGTWIYTDADNNTFRGAPRGVMANAVTWSIQNVTTSETCQYPIIDYYGECSIAETTAKGETTGFYAYRSKTVEISDLAVTGCASYGIRINDCANVRIGKSSSRGNGHGAYVYSKQNAIPEIRDCDFSGNAGYGLLMTGTTITPGSAGNLQLNHNRYGIRVNNRPLTLTPAMNVQVTGNQYGVLCQRDELSLSGIELVGNDIGAYCSRGSLSIEKCDVAATRYGVLGYLDGDCEITKSKFNDAAYGVYLRCVGTQDSPIQIAQSSVTGATRCGVYVRGDPANRSTVQIRDCSIRNGRQGLVFRDAEVHSDNVRFTDLSSTGVYQASGSGTIQRCTFTRLTGSWGVLARGDRCDIAQSSILAGRYGIALQTAQGSVTNCVIAGTDYGIHLRGTDATYAIVHTTVAAAKFFGLIRYSGDTTVRNSIFDVASYGLYNANPDGVFDHQYNLVHASRRPYTNSGPGIGEVNDPPLFVDPGGGDFHLAMGSPAINSGVDLSGLVSIDLDGNPRPSFQGYEMGAYEFMEPSGSIRVLKWDEVAR